jgi:hypothetical protein
LKGWQTLAYLDVRKVITLHCGDTTTLVEANLPHTRQIGQQVPNAFAVSHVPHLKRAVGAGDDFLPVMLEAGDSAGVRTKRRLASTSLRVPDAQRTIRSSRDETIMAEVQKANKRGVALEVKEASARVEIPHFDQVVHAA